jgi:magnesium-protoporphyrin O-methyltransferase
VSGCCARHGQEELFGERFARRAARRYRRKGPDAMARSLARRAAARGLEGVTVLEIGGGIGQVLLQLLARGAREGEVVELVPAYEDEAAGLAAEAGVGERASYRTADLVADPEAGRPADVVVLNKVVCCTPDGVELAGIAASLARRTLVLSFPRDAWWARAAFASANAAFRLRRRRFRTYVHPPAALVAAVEGHGLELASTRDGPLFRIAAFERAYP